MKLDFFLALMMKPALLRWSRQSLTFEVSLKSEKVDKQHINRASSAHWRKYKQNECVVHSRWFAVSRLFSYRHKKVVKLCVCVLPLHYFPYVLASTGILACKALVCLCVHASSSQALRHVCLCSMDWVSATRHVFKHKLQDRSGFLHRSVKCGNVWKKKMVLSKAW